MPALRISATPNPNSLKFTTEDGPFIASGLLSFASASQAEGHPLGRALFAVEGVANVLALPAFVTITKTEGADWNAVLPRVQAALEAHLDRPADER